MSDSLAHFLRSSLQITGGGGLTSIDAIFNLIPDAISNLKTIASFFASFAVLPKFMPGISYWSQHAGGSVQYTQLVVAVTSRYSRVFFGKISWFKQKCKQIFESINFFDLKTLNNTCDCSLGNLDQRNAVRKTWKKLTGQTQDAKLFFVMVIKRCLHTV